MTNSDTPNVLVLGGTGKTGRRISAILTERGVTHRTAARSSADVVFDWDDTSTHDAALDGIDTVYLVPPALRLDHPPLMAEFVDRAERAGVSHVSFLSANGVEHAPAESPLRAVELDLAARTGITHSLLRPSWFMQNFDEAFFQPSIAAAGMIPAPTGDGTEAFVHADDIADVAVETLTEPERHAGRAYTITGPQALGFADVADRIGAALDRPIQHLDVDRQAWIDQTVEHGGVPAPYAEVLAGLFDIIRAGHGATPSSHTEAVTGHPARSFDEYLADPDVTGAWR